MPDLNQMSQFIKSIIELLDSSSFQFILHPVKSKHLLVKSIQIIFLLFTLFSSFYYVYLNLIDYLNYDTITSIYQINEIKSEFPVVSFCNPNMPQFEMIIKTFWFNNKKLKDDWKNHIESYNDTSYGKCYRYNSGKNMTNHKIPIKYSKTSGFDAAFYFRFYSDTVLDYGELLVYIHNRTQIVSTIKGKAFKVTAGAFNVFSIKRICDQKLGYPFNDCFKNVSLFTFNTTFIDFISSQNREYTQKECISLMNNNNLSENSLNLYCPLECDTFNYDIRLYTQTLLSYGKIRNTTYVYEFKNWENVTKTMFGLRIFYEDLRYTLITQQARIELFGLISNLGGGISLFLSLNFISLFEIFEILVEIIIYYSSNVVVHN